MGLWKWFVCQAENIKQQPIGHICKVQWGFGRVERKKRLDIETSEDECEAEM